MRAHAEFAKTTLIGGLLIILPIYISVLLLLKALKGLLGLLAPITNAIPVGVESKQFLAAGVLLAICFFVGLIIRTGIGRRTKNAIEMRCWRSCREGTIFRWPRQPFVR